MRRLLTYVTLVTCLWLYTCCTQPARHYVIGVSQCSEDIWREKQNAELRMGTYFHHGVELCFAAAYDSDQRQIEQIDSLVACGIDLLIVAPNQVATISPAIDRAYDKGIPVIVFERKTSSQKYTAFMSADNYEMGRQMGEYIAAQLHGKGRVMEIMGLKGSSPAIERHNGFVDAIKSHPGIEIVATLQGDWTEESAIKAIENYQGDLNHIDFVFGQNDRMAMGARKAMSEVTSPLSSRRGAEGEAPKFCGIDGLPGKEGGIRLVRDSILAASYIYPTHGDRLLQLAIDILDGKPYQKETKLMSAIVTSDNANVLLMQSEEMLRQASNLDDLHRQADGYLHQLDTQRTITWLAIGIIALLIMVFVLFYLYHLSKINIQRERVVNTLWNMESEKLQPAPEPSADSVEQTAEKKPEPASPENTENEKGSQFLARFREVVEKRLGDSEVSVEDLASDMNLSRVQLYRKVKNVTGSSPVELLRTTRLNKAYQLLMTTDKSISEVAYQVGFTAPSYFTKCFKEEYGMLPGNVKNN